MELLVRSGGREQEHEATSQTPRLRPLTDDCAAGAPLVRGRSDRSPE